ncbi:PREDICTED: AT-hook motif nuclear-localized protein 28-like [Nelumbo nucifera]|uniref:AT-hook motif nuclear-localized protein 28-like n=2 Tax=Nelumbo nucifera TaxID=4432 RepID=A0A1U8B0N7_NELNU|nr:PREDICTED: AT-hook motif nuclear-localized protein 28-like [Nelumbo nucifera]XP_010269402.1 PREDICTED: AT-hook motif nuclear-localized protein 28-like [Nelumbo nucifera]XP_010269403.1 PREDICTED: AT-hook motif nuclear-localized protein 28-like [Nelumbo nucifera]XP_010269404.1 PREDICTED: AT-hook motif nuclear-localized protein 28-like [Nelumbo nucifera]XP_010269405.1 PREDICTED: AT-hook motif nuclear-localized protein 28-like [Nelumbo nucifera]XP_010269407.1 PREDICTED: AT-hook motif nuclear-lo
MADYGGAISLSQTRECHTSEEEDDEHSARNGTPFMGGGGVTKVKINHNNNKTGGDVGSMVEVVRKPRGRPPGSKNKPKPPIVITRDSECAMRPVVLEVSAGSDVVEMVSQFARRRHVGLSILSGSGTVANVTLRHPASHTSTLTLTGPFHIVSLSGTFLGSSSSSSTSSSTSKSCPPFTISLAGGHGQVFGGTVAGSLVAGSTVVLVAASFVNPTFHRLPGDDEETEDVKPVNLVSGSSDSCTTNIPMAVYSIAAPTPLNCQIPPEVLPWPPTSRPPY